MKIKKEDKRTLVIVFLMIFFLLTVLFLRFKNFDPSGATVTFPSSKEVNIPSFEELFFQENIDALLKEHDDEKYFFSETSYTRKHLEEDIVFEYPSHWEEINVSKQEESDNLKMLFLAYSPVSTFPKTMTVFKTSENSIEKVIKQIEAEIKEEVEKFEIVEKRESDNGYLIRSSYNTPEGFSFVSSKKIVFLKEGAYIFFLSSLNNQWSSFEEAVDYIFSSIQIKQHL